MKDDNILDERDRLIATRVAEGIKVQDISEELGISLNSTYKRLRKDKVQNEIQRLEKIKAKEVEKRLTGALDEIVDALLQLANNAESESVRLSAINSVLDRTLGKATNKVEVNADITNKKELTWDDLEGEVIDVNFNEDEDDDINYGGNK